ncbi:uncharacterized [Tachysurus ichikawai]
MRRAFRPRVQDKPCLRGKKRKTCPVHARPLSSSPEIRGHVVDTLMLEREYDLSGRRRGRNRSTAGYSQANDWCLTEARRCCVRSRSSCLSPPARRQSALQSQEI